MKKYLVFKDGEKKEILEENGKYYICKNSQWRKASDCIAGIEMVAEEKKAEYPQEKLDSEVETPKKVSKQKTKKGE